MVGAQNSCLRAAAAMTPRAAARRVCRTPRRMSEIRRGWRYFSIYDDVHAAKDGSGFFHYFLFAAA